MAENPEIPAAPDGMTPATEESARPEPAEAPPASAADVLGESGSAPSGSPSLVGSYATPAPDAGGEATPGDNQLTAEDSPPPTPPVFVAGYSAPPSPADGEPSAPALSAPAAAADAGVEAADRPFLEPLAATPTAPQAVESGLEPSLGSVVEPTGKPSIAPPSAAAPSEAGESSPPPGIAASLLVSPLPEAEAGEGGEWDLLVNKIRAWFDGADVQQRWESLGGPLRAAGLLLGAVVALRLYSALLETLGDLPLVPRLLQLVGLITLVRFCLTRLVRSSERERIVGQWKERWNDFRGRD